MTLHHRSILGVCAGSQVAVIDVLLSFLRGLSVIVLGSLWCANLG